MVGGAFVPFRVGGVAGKENCGVLKPAQGPGVFAC